MPYKDSEDPKEYYNAKQVVYTFLKYIQTKNKSPSQLAWGMTKTYVVEFKIHRKMAYYSLQKIVLDRFPQNFFI